MTCTFTNVKMSTIERMEIRGNMKLCMYLGKTPTKTYKMLQMAKGRVRVFLMAQRFSEGQLASNYS